MNDGVFYEVLRDMVRARSVVEVGDTAQKRIETQHACLSAPKDLRSRVDSWHFTCPLLPRL